MSYHAEREIADYVIFVILRPRDSDRAITRCMSLSTSLMRRDPYLSNGSLFITMTPEGLRVSITFSMISERASNSI